MRGKGGKKERKKMYRRAKKKDYRASEFYQLKFNKTKSQATLATQR